MAWVINLFVLYGLAFLFWNERKYKRIHILWVPPAIFCLMLALGVVFGTLLR